MVDAYGECAGKRADKYHGNMTQDGAGSRTLAQYWHQGSDWALTFCEVVGLPEVLAKRQGRVLPDDEEVIPATALDPLHTFQLEVHRRLRRFLNKGRGKATMLSLPTGAVKTRVTVQAVCEHLAAETGSRRRGVVLWISQSDELQRQAWECFRQVWQAGGAAGKSAGRAKYLPLRIVRLWGGRRLDSISIRDEPTVLIAGIDQLSSWVRTAQKRRGEPARLAREMVKTLAGRRLSAVVVDEAHHLGNDETRRVLVALGIRAKRQWQPASNSAPVVGLTATPWRTQRKELGRLLRFFGQRLLRPSSLGSRPVKALVGKRVLATFR
ncbi:MAG: DEAD/DEAH box helicase family protein [Acidobacteria bacterium]|nr:DEAD/DEAH box helicase family protein [Acidobacteriota bacterium]